MNCAEGVELGVYVNWCADRELLCDVSTASAPRTGRIWNSTHGIELKTVTTSFPKRNWCVFLGTDLLTSASFLKQL
jgi:hypothetical protein